MKCHFCAGPLIWQSDFNAEDYGYEQSGLVAVLMCGNCGAQWEGIQLDEDEEEEDDV